ncbi:outer membrane protein assembly factor BamB family protein [Halorussus halophilus]|uniref:outer membrane protein assembly factor BamB family protein n=1 Tax=Halorussus halophilus TaxID=2650975 RepID=UPI001301790B|nr:PQQ-binding-like beta-propeller repeat protein [Halorussus halophilus]
MPADIDPENEVVEPEERQHHIDTGPEARDEDEVINLQGVDTEFRFGGQISGWQGRAPESISGATNPTLNLEAGNRYRVVWENVDGAPHDFVIQNSNGDRIVGTEVFSQQGQTVTLTFDATAEMAQYICTVHPNSMVGEVQVSGGDQMAGGGATGDGQQGPGATQQEIPDLSVTTNMLREDAEREDSWLHYDKGYGQRGFTPEDRLDADNVASLERKYSIPTDSAGMQTNPLVVPTDPPVMYYTTSNINVHAANARTGEKYWIFKYALPEDAAGQTGRNRGVAVWHDKVYLATTDSHLVALNRYTGEKEWDTLMLNEQQQEMGQPKRMSITQAPLAYDGRILVGMSGDFGGWCVVSSVDAETGEVQWQTNMSPRSEWVGESWRFSSDAPWMNPSIDPETNQVFYAVGNPCPMMNGIVRPGPNKHSNSIVALDIESGDLNWASQQLAHELWDYDTHMTPNVFDMEMENGETRRVVSTDYKAAWTYVYDAETGQLVERTKPWATQDHEWSDHFLALPPAGEDNPGTCWPGTSGATEWPPGAYSPETGLRYIPANDAAQRIFYDPDWEYNPTGDITLAEGGSRLASEETSHSAYVQALDPQTGDLAWRTELPDASSKWSQWRIWPGGATATSGNLVFVASSGGHLYALDAENGERIWAGETDADRITAAPVVWDDPAEETTYVALAADDEITVWSSSGFEE